MHIIEFFLYYFLPFSLSLFLCQDYQDRPAYSRPAVLNLGYARSPQGVHKIKKKYSKETNRGYAKLKKNTQKKLIWVEFLIRGYAKKIQL